jgi:hypothetical protein
VVRSIRYIRSVRSFVSGNSATWGEVAEKFHDLPASHGKIPQVEAKSWKNSGTCWEVQEKFRVLRGKNKRAPTGGRVGSAADLRGGN